MSGRPRPGGPSARLVQRSFALGLVLGVLGLLLAPVGVTQAPVARGASSGLTMVTSAQYSVMPAQARVRVVVDLTATNSVADTTVNRFFFDHAFLAVQAGASGVKVVKGPKGAAVQVSSSTADATILRIGFGGKLYGGSSLGLRFQFDLVDVGTSARRLVRVGTSLITFPVWAYASDGASGSRVSVHFPPGYNVAVESGSFASTGRASDGGVLLSTGALANPLGFFAYVSGQQAATYLSSSLAVPVADGSIALTLNTWKDDKSWAGRVGALFKQALPVLRQQIGLAWPHDGPVVVQEAVSRSTGGYAGLYDPKAGQIQVAYWASSAVVVHEAAHGWFNGGLVADRWAAEGFASYYSQQALGALKIKAAPPTLTAQLKAAGYPLNAWPATPAPASASEAFGYAASYTLAAAIAKRAGPDALARVWGDAWSRTGAYQPPAGQWSGAPETVDGPPDWRGLLDLLESETGADFTDLWRTWVVRPDEAGLLDQRAVARSAYAAALAAADGWALPRSVRDALRSWQFDSADALLAQARQVLAQRDALGAQARAAGLTLPATVRSLFEAGDFAGAAAEEQREADAIAAIAAAASAQTASSDPVTAVGMVGADPARELTAAKAALSAGDPAAALASAGSASQAWADAPGEGRRRVLMAAALLVALGALGASLASRLRRPRRPPQEPAAS